MSRLEIRRGSSAQPHDLTARSFQPVLGLSALLLRTPSVGGGLRPRSSDPGVAGRIWVLSATLASRPSPIAYSRPRDERRSAGNTASLGVAVERQIIGADPKVTGRMCGGARAVADGPRAMRSTNERMKRTSSPCLALATVVVWSSSGERCIRFMTAMYPDLCAAEISGH